MTATERQLAVQDLLARYASCLDQGRFEEWPEFFTEDCLYQVIPRENHEAGLPLSTMLLEGRGMLRDRVYAVTQTLYHAPYYQRHVIGLPLVTDSGGEPVTAMEANYVVFRTHVDQPTEVLSAGRYLDQVAWLPGGPKFREKRCVFDSELIGNSIIYPI